MSVTEEQLRALTGTRQEAWRFDILNLQDKKIGELETAKSATFDMSIFTTIRTSGSLSCVLPKDWLQTRIQPWYTMTTPTGEELSWPIGVFIPATPGTGYTGSGKSQEVELYDKLLILDQDTVEESYSVPSGTVVTTRVKQILASAGESKDTVADSSEILRSSLFWEAGTTKLKVVNDLLDAINYFSLDVDGNGVFHAEPYVAPNRRGTEWEFLDNEFSIYSPDFQHEADTFNVPNKMVQVSATDGEEPALVSVRTNEDSKSPYSYQARGRWLTTVETEVEATSQKVLDGIAARRLNEVTAVTSTYEIQHALIPLGLNKMVAFRNEAGEIDTVATVQKLSFGTETGSLVSTNIREVTL